MGRWVHMPNFPHIPCEPEGANLNTCADRTAQQQYFPGRNFPGNASVRRSVRFNTAQQRLGLMDVDAIVGSTVVQYAARAANFANPTSPFLDQNAIVAQVTVPGGFQVQSAKAFCSISDSELSGVVLFAVVVSANDPTGGDIIVDAWDGALTKEMDIPVGGDLAMGGVNVTFSLRAIVAPAFWSAAVAGVTGSGATPLRSNLAAYGELKVVALAQSTYQVPADC